MCSAFNCERRVGSTKYAMTKRQLYHAGQHATDVHKSMPRVKSVLFVNASIGSGWSTVSEVPNGPWASAKVDQTPRVLDDVNCPPNSFIAAVPQEREDKHKLLLFPLAFKPLTRFFLSPLARPISPALSGRVEDRFAGHFDVGLQWHLCAR